jgi:hypothetical protein
MILSGIIQLEEIIKFDEIDAKTLICLNKEISDTVLVSSVNIRIVRVVELRGYPFVDSIASDGGSMSHTEVTGQRTRLRL